MNLFKLHELYGEPSDSIWGALAIVLLFAGICDWAIS